MRLSIMLVALVLTAQPLIAKEIQSVTFTELEIKAAKQYPKSFTIDPLSVEIENLGPAIKPQQFLKNPVQPKEADTLVVIDKIINTAMKIWEIIEKNRPVVDISTTYANAIPGQPCNLVFRHTKTTFSFNLFDLHSCIGQQTTGFQDSLNLRRKWWECSISISSCGKRLFPNMGGSLRNL